jgi:hypothetical protein
VSGATVAARRGGASSIDAARRASRNRFRAVLLTSATTIAGLIPLMFETSRQAQSLIPVATSIVFGITATTVLVLIALPAIYAVLADLGLVAPPTPEDPDAEEGADSPPGQEVGTTGPDVSAAVEQQPH